MSLSLVSLIFSNGPSVAVDTVRLSLESDSAFWFRLVKYSGYAVAFGCLLEAPETVVIIKRWLLLRFKDHEYEETKEDRKSWFIPLAAIGLIIIVVGIVAETYFEGRVSDVDADLRAHESDKITAAENEAAAATKQAGSAAASAIAANKAAGEAQTTANGVAQETAGLEARSRAIISDLEAQEPRAVLLSRNEKRLTGKLSAFPGQRFTIDVCGIFNGSRDGKEMTDEWDVLSDILIGPSVKWKLTGTDPSWRKCKEEPGTYVHFNPDGPESTVKAAHTLCKELSSILPPQEMGVCEVSVGNPTDDAEAPWTLVNKDPGLIVIVVAVRPEPKNNANPSSSKKNQGTIAIF